MGHQLSPEACHYPRSLTLNQNRRLKFDPTHVEVWKADAKQTLTRLLGKMPERGDLNIRQEWQVEHDKFTEIRFFYSAEPNVDVPAHLLIPRSGKAPYPVIICLQGHTSGMHISLGRPKDDKDVESISGDRDYAIQAVDQGYAALVIEQRAFGERHDDRPEAYHHGVDRPCFHASLAALLVGRTLLGERVWDVSRGIDALSHFPMLDTSRVATLGDSTGGTIAYYSACYDERVTAAMPTAYICTFKHTLAIHDHCEDHYLPGLMEEFELSDLAGLIAPRPLIAVHGRFDISFPYEGTVESFGEIKDIYRAFGAEENCALVTGEGVHQFFADISWPVFNQITGWKK